MASNIDKFNFNTEDVDKTLSEYTPQSIEMMLLSGDAEQMELATAAINQGLVNTEAIAPLAEDASNLLSEAKTAIKNNIEDLTSIRSTSDFREYATNVGSTLFTNFMNIGEGILNFLESMKDGIELSFANTSATQLEMNGVIEQSERAEAIQGVADNVAIDYTGDMFDSYWNSEHGQNVNEHSYIKQDGLISQATKGATEMGLYILSSIHPVGWAASATSIAGTTYEESLNEGKSVNETLTSAAPMVAVDFGLNMVGAKTIAEPLKGLLKSAGSSVKSGAKEIATKSINQLKSVGETVKTVGKDLYEGSRNYILDDKAYLNAFDKVKNAFRKKESIPVDTIIDSQKYADSIYPNNLSRMDELASIYKKNIEDTGVAKAFETVNEYGLREYFTSNYMGKAISAIKQGENNITVFTKENDARNILSNYSIEEIEAMYDIYIKLAPPDVFLKINGAVDPIQDSSNLQSIVKAYYSRKSEEDAYIIFTSISSHGREKTLPSQKVNSDFYRHMKNMEDANKLELRWQIDGGMILGETSIKNLEKTMSVEYERYFSHFISKNFPEKDVTQRLYVNLSDFGDTYEFVKQFIDKCETRGIPHYCKIGYCDNGGKIAAHTLTRDESIVIYSNDAYISDYLSICREIKEESKFEFFSPPALTTKIDGVFGYGAEPLSGASYNRVRANLLEECIKGVETSYESMCGKSINLDDPDYLFYLKQYIQSTAPNHGVNPNNFALNLK